MKRKRVERHKWKHCCFQNECRCKMNPPSITKPPLSSALSWSCFRHKSKKQEVLCCELERELERSLPDHLLVFCLTVWAVNSPTLLIGTLKRHEQRKQFLDQDKYDVESKSFDDFSYFMN